MTINGLQVEQGEKGVLLHLSVQILSFNGLKISPNLKVININEIELLLNN